ncbi:hypothetical protein GCM10018777_09800 [Streptomyces albogriseolus]|nr:hypothetical protein GCM10018777_09800 [Streptomyces viridodiastaticus]
MAAALDGGERAEPLGREQVREGFVGEGAWSRSCGHVPRNTRHPPLDSPRMRQGARRWSAGPLFSHRRDDRI